MAGWFKWFPIGGKGARGASEGGERSLHATTSVPSSRTSELAWFEVQECPHEFRFAILPNQPLLFGCHPEPGAEVCTWLLAPGQDAALVRTLIGKLGQLVQLHHVLAPLPQSPTNAFSPSAMATPSLHLRVAFGPDRSWQSCYDGNHIPATILAFYDDVKALGLREIAGRPGQNIPAERVVQAVQAMSSDNVGKLKMTVDGRLYLIASWFRSTSSRANWRSWPRRKVSFGTTGKAPPSPCPSRSRPP